MIRIKIKSFKITKRATALERLNRDIHIEFNTDDGIIYTISGNNGWGKSGLLHSLTPSHLSKRDVTGKQFTKLIGGKKEMTFITKVGNETREREVTCTITYTPKGGRNEARAEVTSIDPVTGNIVDYTHKDTTLKSYGYVLESILGFNKSVLEVAMVNHDSFAVDRRLNIIRKLTKTNKYDEANALFSLKSKFYKSQIAILTKEINQVDSDVEDRKIFKSSDLKEKQMELNTQIKKLEKEITSKNSKLDKSRKALEETTEAANSQNVASIIMLYKLLIYPNEIDSKLTIGTAFNEVVSYNTNRKTIKDRIIEIGEEINISRRIIELRKEIETTTLQIATFERKMLINKADYDFYTSYRISEFKNDSLLRRLDELDRMKEVFTPIDSFDEYLNKRIAEHSNLEKLITTYEIYRKDLEKLTIDISDINCVNKECKFYTEFIAKKEYIDNHENQYTQAKLEVTHLFKLIKTLEDTRKSINYYDFKDICRYIGLQNNIESIIKNPIKIKNTILELYDNSLEYSSNSNSKERADIELLSLNRDLSEKSKNGLIDVDKLQSELNELNTSLVSDYSIDIEEAMEDPIENPNSSMLITKIEEVRKKSNSLEKEVQIQEYEIEKLEAHKDRLTGEKEYLLIELGKAETSEKAYDVKVQTRKEYDDKKKWVDALIRHTDVLYRESMGKITKMIKASANILLQKVGSELSIVDIYIEKENMFFRVRTSDSEDSDLSDLNSASAGEKATFKLAIQSTILLLYSKKYRVLYLDEVDANLSEDNRIKFIKLLQILVTEGELKIIMISHILDREVVNEKDVAFKNRQNIILTDSTQEIPGIENIRV